jgi:hypothetical protein
VYRQSFLDPLGKIYPLQLPGRRPPGSAVGVNQVRQALAQNVDRAMPAPASPASITLAAPHCQAAAAQVVPEWGHRIHFFRLACSHLNRQICLLHACASDARCDKKLLEKFFLAVIGIDIYQY